MARLYPRWIYHPKKGGVIVTDAAHEAAHGEGWSDSPDFKVEEVPVVEPVKAKGGRPKKVTS